MTNDTIPEEARILAEEFKTANWKLSSPKEKKLKIPKRGTADDAIRLATQSGFQIDIGGGKHNTHVVDRNGNLITEIPRHGGSGRTLSTGVWHSILKDLGLK